MRGVNFLKNAVISVLLAYFIAHAVPWVDTKSAVCVGILTAELAMYFLTAYDEIQRQRMQGRKRKGKRS